MIIPVKKTTLNNAGHIDAKLSDFSEICPKKSSEIGRFLLIVSWRSFPPKFPSNRPIFLRICPRKSLETWLFSAKIPQNRPIFPRILTFFPWNQPIFPRICPWKSCEILLFFPRNTRSPVMIMIMIMIILLLLWHIKSVKFILLQSMLNSTISRHYNLFTLEVGKFFFCFFFLTKWGSYNNKTEIKDWS